MRSLLLLVAAVGLAAAQCSSSGDSTLYTNNTGCTAAVTCAQNLCTCVNGTWNASTSTCAYSMGGDCTKTQACIGVKTACQNAIGLAALSSGCASPLGTLHTNLLALQAGTALWNASSTYMGCQAYTCKVINWTIASGCTMPDYTVTCATPFSTSVYVLFGGNWTAVLSARARSAATKAAAIAGINADVLAASGYMPSSVTLTLTAAAHALATITIPASAGIVSAFVTSVGTTTTWLTSTKAAFTAGGGTGFSVIGEGTGAITDAPVATPTPATPSPSGVGIATVAQVLAAVLAMLVLA